MKFIREDFYKTFKAGDFFTKEDLYEYFNRKEKDLNISTFTWRIFELKKKNIIRTVGKNMYSICDKPEYKPFFSKEVTDTAKLLTDNYESLEYCISETGWLNEFTVHQAFKSHVIVEVEKDIVESAYYYLKDNTGFEVFFEPDKKTIDYYVTETSNAVIVKKLITRSPVQLFENIATPVLEKILVDLYRCPELYYMYQGSEMVNIFRNSLDKYMVNFALLLGYSQRRGAKNGLKEFLKENLSDLTKGLIND